MLRCWRATIKHIGMTEMEKEHTRESILERVGERGYIYIERGCV